ncbi:PrsW family intramembrane metalloprotease [Actinomadura darangshiensis]|uniref:PrsW family intramembrane metalloprotease n=1 Tax=Actinomadura darangshiensis TaxID=705336 RepID=A0A4R5BYZ2_9ACTN|nr:PrsW family intramembrane metalloprotease [Actinomadura darangshiensis]TDD91429.1 PrsW family intramembrane metalloprotease [Actinomadura darangshiensis]
MTAAVPAGAAVPATAEEVPADVLARTRALLIARIAIGLYLLELLLNLTRPKLQDNEPTLTIFQHLPKTSGSLGRLLAMPKAVFWTVIAGIVIGAALQAFVAITRPEGRRAANLTWATLAALLGPVALFSLTVVAIYPLQALICVPGTAFVLWLLHHGQRFARMPLSMLLTGFGWGALLVFGLSRAYGGLLFGAVNAYMAKGAHNDMNALLKTQYRVTDFLLLHMEVVNALVLAGGILVLTAMFRHRLDLVTGLILGAAIGLGYNLVESVLFIKLFGSLGAINGATAGFEFWIRQSIGLLGSQVAFGAVLGAAMGLAAQHHNKRFAYLGLAAAIGGAIGTENLAPWLAHQADVTAGSPADTLIASPFFWLLPQAPFIITAALLLRTGLRTRAAEARAAISAELSAGPAITRAEAPYLMDPSLRLWSLYQTWRHHGLPTARTLHKIQTTQLSLAARRRQHQQSGDPHTHKQAADLQTKVMNLKTGAEQ